jgi:hypothetical protein
MKGRLGMKKFNITISREFGCNSREITRMLASRLGVEMYDRDLVDMQEKWELILMNLRMQTK